MELTGSNIPIVAELDLKLHRANIDAQAKNVWVYAEVMVGLSDGSTRSGVTVSFFANGKPCIEASTDDFGRAVLDAGIHPKFFLPFSANELAVRVKGSAKTSKATFSLLEGSSLSEARYDNEEVNVSQRETSREVYWRTTFKEALTVELRVSNKDFRTIQGIPFVVILQGRTNQASHKISMNEHGVGRLELTNIWTRRENAYGDKSDNGRHLDSVEEVYVQLDDFPESYRLHATVKH